MLLRLPLLPDGAATRLSLSLCSVPPAAVSSDRGIIHCFQVSVREEGYSVLVRGLKACLLRAFLVNAAIFGGYESTMEGLMRYGFLASQQHQGAGGGGAGAGQQQQVGGGVAGHQGAQGMLSEAAQKTSFPPSG